MQPKTQSGDNISERVKTLKNVRKGFANVRLPGANDSVISLPINGVKKERFVVTLFSDHAAKLTQLKSLQRSRQSGRNSTDFISSQSAMLVDRS
jgi:hypothetical protein